MRDKKYENSPTHLSAESFRQRSRDGKKNYGYSNDANPGLLYDEHEFPDDGNDASQRGGRQWHHDR